MADIKYALCPHCGKGINLKVKLKYSITIVDTEKSEVDLP